MIGLTNCTNIAQPLGQLQSAGGYLDMWTIPATVGQNEYNAFETLSSNSIGFIPNILVVDFSTSTNAVARIYCDFYNKVRYGYYNLSNGIIFSDGNARIYSPSTSVSLDPVSGTEAEVDECDTNIDGVYKYISGAQISICSKPNGDISFFLDTNDPINRVNYFVSGM